MKSILKSCGLLIVALLCGCATVLDEDGALAVVPYHLQDSGRVVVEVQVNGEGPFAFALDTAASISVVFDKLRDDLAIEPEPGKAVLIHGAVTSGKFPVLIIDRLELGRETWVNARVAALPGDTASAAKVDGMLGIDFLRRYAVGFSTTDRVIRLYPPELVSSRTYRGWTAVPLRAERILEGSAALYFIELDIGDQTIPAIFDLGAGLNLMNHAAAESLGVAEVAARKKGQLAGAIESTPIVSWIRVDEISTGGVRWRNETFDITELGVLSTLVPRGTPCAILGAGLFTQRDFIIDFTGSRLLIKTAMDEVDKPESNDAL